MLAAVLDTCVIYSGLRRDFLLSLAAQGVFRLVLTEDVLFEIGYVEERKLIEGGVSADEAAARAAWLVKQMRSFPVLDDDRVQLIGPVGLPDPDDEHLVAAAVAGGAEVIVTDNVKHLPAKLLPNGVRTQRPEAFLHDMVAVHRRRAGEALRQMSERRQRPPQSPHDIIDLMVVREHILGDTTSMLRDAVEPGARRSRGA